MQTVNVTELQTDLIAWLERVRVLMNEGKMSRTGLQQAVARLEEAPSI